MAQATPVISGIREIELAQGDTILCPETGKTMLAVGTEIDAIPPSSSKMALGSFGSEYCEFFRREFEIAA